MWSPCLPGKRFLEQDVPLAPTNVAVGVPADALRRRPDVRGAERKLAAQTAQIGVAKAERYPSFSLLGSIGVESLQFANLYSASARAAQGAAKAAWTLFDGGSIRQNIKLQTALQEEEPGLPRTRLTFLDPTLPLPSSRMSLSARRRTR